MTRNGGAPALFTDLYELTMLQAYVARGMTDTATFSLAVRKLPPERNLLIAAGLGTLLDDLESLHFCADDLAYLRGLATFGDDFLDWLGRFRFSGRIDAMPEGTPVFAGEPILEVTAPLPEAQLIETLVLNRIQLATLAASKAVRVVHVAAGRKVVDFGARRAHGIDAALEAARAFHIAGVGATSNVLAGQRYGVAVAGTMAHSFVQAHDDEAAALRSFAGLYPETILLVDTYDTLDGVAKVIDLARELGDEFRVRGVRLDSGDLGDLAERSRRLLDAAGLERVEIFASGGLDEAAIADLVGQGAPIDGFGVGTHMAVSRDVPALDIAYKLCAHVGRGRLKLATGKPVLPGRKQVFRQDGGDVIARADERLDGRPLLVEVMRDGKRLPAGRDDLETARERCRTALDALPAAIRGVAPADEPWPVAVSPALADYDEQVRRAVAAG
ncbi:MAG: nicotinate phosphoribosyltransferase, partial [Pseudomonadota bacterium]